jgi:hypothetical protein
MHRGSQHLISARQKRKHKQQCRTTNVPFTDLEAENLRASNTHTGDYNPSSLSNNSDSVVKDNSLR